MDSFTCPNCQQTSYHPEDVRHGYCGACHDYTGQTGFSADRQLNALREDVHKALMEAGEPCSAFCGDVAGFLLEVGWRHPEIDRG